MDEPKIKFLFSTYLVLSMAYFPELLTCFTCGMGFTWSFWIFEGKFF